MTACKIGPKVMHKKGEPKRTTPVRPAGQVGFDNPATLVGTSKWTGSDGTGIGVYYDPASSTGQALAQDVLSNRIDDIMNYCDDCFGVKGKSGNVLIIPGNSGAYHAGCNFNADGAGGSDWYEDDMGGVSPTPAGSAGGLVVGLVMAEVCESYMGLQNKGIDCGGSGGEGISRKLAEMVSGGITGAMSGGFSARSSYDGSDWISRDQGTDQDYPSIGCSMLFCDWMQSLGFSMKKIIQAGEPDGTLATTYAALTGKPATQAFADFQAAVAKVDINATNPFNIKDDPYPLTPTPPPTGVNALVITSTLSAGMYAITDTTGATVGLLSVTTSVSPGTYPIGATPPPPTSVGSVAVVTSLAIGNYTVPSVGSIALTGPLAAGGTYTIQATSGEHLTIPPWLLAILKLACSLAPSLPPPYGTLAALLCSFLPPSERCK